MLVFMNFQPGSFFVLVEGTASHYLSGAVRFLSQPEGPDIEG